MDLWIAHTQGKERQASSLSGFFLPLQCLMSFLGKRVTRAKNEGVQGRACRESCFCPGVWVSTCAHLYVRQHRQVCLQLWSSVGCVRLSVDQTDATGCRCECGTAWTSMLSTPAPFRSIFYTPDFWVSLPELLISGLPRVEPGPQLVPKT